MLASRLLDFLVHHHLTDKPLIVGYSGGLDSCVLLHLLAQIRPHLSVNPGAIYVNHGLSPHADSWQAHCEAQANALGLDFSAVKVELVKGSRTSLEQLARDARYQAFVQHTPQDAVVLTAHHQDDQAETLLLRLFRGSGLKGLGAMQALRKLDDTRLLARPLLSLSRQSLEAYATENALTWVEDESNQDDVFDRNFVRLSMLPQIRQRWQGAVAAMGRTARLCQQEQKLLEEYLSQDLIRVSSENRIEIQALTQLSPAKQAALLRLWLERLGFPMPSEVLLRRVFDELIPARADADPQVNWQGVSLRRYQGKMYALQDKPVASWEMRWDLTGELSLPNQLGSLRFTREKPQHNYLALPLGCVEVTLRSHSENVKLELSAGRRKTLSKWLKEKGVPPWQRQNLPFVFSSDSLLGVPGLFAVDVEQAAGYLVWVKD